MDPRRLIAAAVLVAVIPFGAGSAVGAANRSRPSGAERPVAIGAQPVVKGLNSPSAFTVAPDGRFFYGERLTGQIRIYDPATQSNKLFYQVTNLSNQGEQGLLGLALDPGYPGRPLV